MPEYLHRINGDDDLGVKGPFIIPQPIETSWTIAESKNGFTKSIIYVDSPGLLNQSKVTRRADGFDVVPEDTKLSVVQFVEVIDKNQNMKRVAHKLILLKVNIDKAGKVDTGFVSESDPTYKKTEAGFLNNN
jgi:hypothetical protein